VPLPEIVIDLAKIAKNVQVVQELARPYGIEIVAVTKGVLADINIVRAILAGGIKLLADSRLENLQNLREAFPDTELMLLRIPGPSQITETVRLANISLNSEYEVIRGLSEEALRQGKRHRIILMVDLGDLREGVWPSDLPELVAKTKSLPGIQIAGIGVNMACYGGVIPTAEKMAELIELGQDIEQRWGIHLATISGGNSATLPLLVNGQIPAGINQLRVGEGILLGRETIKRTVLPGAYADAFTLRAEIVESQDKPTVPIGKTGLDAFGKTPCFADEGWRTRGILALGRQDVPLDDLVLRDQRLTIFGGSSDHLIVDLSDAPELRVGSVVEFDIGYGGLLGAMTSPYIAKRYL